MIVSLVMMMHILDNGVNTFSKQNVLTTAGAAGIWSAVFRLGEWATFVSTASQAPLP